MSHRSVVAVDLGGTNVRAALCAPDGHILKRHKQATLPHDGTAAVIERLTQSILAVMPSTTDASEPTPSAIGIGTPGSVDPYNGIVLYAANLVWHNVSLRDHLAQRFRLPVGLGNDANLAALGEHRYGAGKGTRDMVYVTLSTGIGCGVILNNQLVLGSRGLATELGHIVMDVHAPAGVSGVPGGFETMASGTAIAAMAQARLSDGAPSALRDHPTVTSKDVGDAANAGDPLAREVVLEVGRVIGLGLVNALHLFDPERIVLGGSVVLIGDLLLGKIRDTVTQYAMQPYRDRPIVLAELGDDCGLLGAAALAWQTTDY
jgi:glucokinase